MSAAPDGQAPIPGLVRRLGRPAAWLAGGAAGLALVWLLGLMWFAAAVPVRVEDPETHTDAIVVLTGGSERLSTGLGLLAAGKAEQLFVSGVHKGVEVGDLLRVARQGRHRELAGSVVLGYAADDTVGNAAETAAWVTREHLRSLRLVTAAYHMRRSLWEFHRAMPGVVIVPHPVFPDAIKSRDWWHRPGTAALLATEYSKYLAAVFRHWIMPKAAPS